MNICLIPEFFNQSWKLCHDKQKYGWMYVRLNMFHFKCKLMRSWFDQFKQLLIPVEFTDLTDWFILIILHSHLFSMIEDNRKQSYAFL